MYRSKQWKSLAATSPFSSVQTPNMENQIYLNEFKWWTVTSAASTLATAECREQEGVEKARRNKIRQREKQWKWSHSEWRTRQEEMRRVIEEQIGASGPRREKHPWKKQMDRRTDRQRERSVCWQRSGSRRRCQPDSGDVFGRHWAARSVTSLCGMTTDQILWGDR